MRPIPTHDEEGLLPAENGWKPLLLWSIPPRQRLPAFGVISFRQTTSQKSRKAAVCRLWIPGS